MDPATAAGLALAIVPLMISALENYEYTFQPIIIFSHRYKREIERFQNALRVQQVDFANECCFLLHTVTLKRGKVMVDDLEHALWQDEDLESRLRAQLRDSYGGCVSALSLINTLLTEILKETKTLEIIQKKKSGRIDVEWLRRLRQRSKISFSKDRFDKKLIELENRIGGLHRIREQVQQIHSVGESPSIASIPHVNHFRIIQRASLRLHEVLSSLWTCESASDHPVDICLDLKDDKFFRRSQNIHFDLVWSCPSRTQSNNQAAQPMQRLLIETSTQDLPEHLRCGQQLESALEQSIRPEGSEGNAHVSPRDVPNLMPSTEPSAMLSDLRSIPDLCQHLIRQATNTASAHCIGYFQEDETFKHLVHAHQGPPNPSPAAKSLEDALMVAKSTPNGIPLPEKFSLARLLALAVLQFHSTPWLNIEWRSRDVVFFGIRDFLQDPLCVPFLKSRVWARARQHANASTVPAGTANTRSPIRNRTLYNLGVLLLELAYNSPLHALIIPEDDQGDPHTLYWTAIRLGEKVKRDLGPLYANAVNICLHCGFGASCELQELKVQSVFFDEVVQNLSRCAEAVSICT